MFRINDKEYLVFFYISSLCEHHLLEISFNPCPDLHKLLGTDFPRKFTIDFHIARTHRVHAHYREDFLKMLGSQKDNEPDYNDSCRRYNTDDGLFV